MKLRRESRAVMQNREPQQRAGTDSCDKTAARRGTVPREDAAPQGREHEPKAVGVSGSERTHRAREGQAEVPVCRNHSSEDL